MNKTLIIALVLFVVALSLPLAAETFTNAKYGFSLEYPGGWEKQLDEQSLLTLINMNQDIPMVVSVVAEPLSDVDLEGGYQKAMEDAMAEIEAELAGEDLGLVEVMERGNFEFNGLPAYRLNLRISLLELMALQMQNVIVNHGDDLIFLSFTGEDSAFSTYAEDFDTIKKSFRLIPKTAAPDTDIPEPRSEAD